MRLPCRRRRSRRIHLRRSSARNHALVGMRANHGDGAHLRAIQRQNPFIIFQQHDTLFRNLPRSFQPTFHIHYASLPRIVHDAAGKFRTQNPPHVLIQLRNRNFALLYRLLQRLAIINIFRLLVIETSRGRFHGAVCAAPIGHHESFEPPRFPQHFRKQIFVLARIIAVNRIVGTHHRARIANLDANVKRQ